MSLTLSFQTRRELLQQMVPRYRRASAAQKGALLDEIAATTGYVRRYAMWLLNHAEERQHPPGPRRQRCYGPEVQHALFLVWHAANRICSKRLMPFLPTLLESLERHGHLHLSEECRSQLLSMSAATADRLLWSTRMQGLRGKSTTRAGTLLKQQIPIRTFAQWNETRPGFLEADLVAHCGREAEGSFLSTLTLTDLATGWTECLPLLSKSAEAVLSALQQARAFFPFPILGLDTDNGGEFINEPLLAFCEQEHITFTRGREGLKNDQCFVEQKNGAIVRQVVGYQRLEGERAYQQLGEVYQALRPYMNGFQPSMKLQAKQLDGRKVRRVYDAAKTPLQRLLLSHVLLASKERELQQVAQVLDPLRLFQHLQDLQQALFDSTTRTSSDGEATSPGALFPFCVERCLARPRAADRGAEEEAGQHVVISAHVPTTVPSAQPDQEADGNAPSFSALASSPADVLSRQTREVGLFSAPPSEKGEAFCLPAETSCVSERGASTSCVGQERASLALVSGTSSPQQPVALTIKQAIQDYLEDRKSHHRRPKTLEWHRHALVVFQHYLQSQHHCLLLDQITGAQVHGWLLFLSQTPATRGPLRSTSTVESYARSARAFCQWLVRHRYLQASPFAHLALPKPQTRLRRTLAPEEWEQMVLACHSTRKIALLDERATSRNRAILWLLFETGMRVSELCELRLSDVDCEQGTLLIGGKGARMRRLTLGHEGLSHLHAYLETYRQGEAERVEQRGASQDHLFLSETGHPLTKNGISLLFDRLRKRAGIPRSAMNPSLLRESFALRYLQSGGEPSILVELLGCSDQATSTRYQRLIARTLAHEQWKGSP